MGTNHMQRNEAEISREFHTWLENTTDYPEIALELAAIQNDPVKIKDAFYQDLIFGTGGLRGVLGAGTNRMNLYTVSQATQGVASYIKKRVPSNKRSVAIAYDSRINSKHFAEITARVLSCNGIKVNIYSRLMPTPMLSWAVRQLKCCAGIMITASHNPANYNGYKVYASDGCQITTQTADEIYDEIAEVALFTSNCPLTFEQYLNSGMISWIKDNIIETFINQVKGQLLLRNNTKTIYENLSVVYTPLNGTGREPVLRALKESGFIHVTVVTEQEEPDGSFPTCPYPNPEVADAMQLGLQYSRQTNADLLIATDPDCDRVGIAVRSREGNYNLLNANETGVLLLDYICKRRTQAGDMPKTPVFIKTIVTTELAEKIADFYGVRTVNVLTGFKYIGEQIGLLETSAHEEDFIFGFEESCGFLSGSYVRDKDGVGTSLLICEMAAFYKEKGLNLIDALKQINITFGNFSDYQFSYIFEGADGLEHMNLTMEKLRNLKNSFTGMDDSQKASVNLEIEAIEDYLNRHIYYHGKPKEQIFNIPVSNVIRLKFKNNCSVTIRPSGTEPKLKIYISIYNHEDGAETMSREILQFIEGFV